MGKTMRLTYGKREGKYSLDKCNGWTDGNWAHADGGNPYNVTVPAYRVGPWYIIKP